MYHDHLPISQWGNQGLQLFPSGEELLDGTTAINLGDRTHTTISKGIQKDNGETGYYEITYKSGEKNDNPQKTTKLTIKTFRYLNYPNEVIVSFETNTYGVFTPSHRLWNIWSCKIPLTDRKKTNIMMS